jgi:hypothetical protein
MRQEDTIGTYEEYGYINTTRASLDIWLECQAGFANLYWFYICYSVSMYPEVTSLIGVRNCICLLPLPCLMWRTQGGLSAIFQSCVDYKTKWWHGQLNGSVEPEPGRECLVTMDTFRVVLLQVQPCVLLMLALLASSLSIHSSSFIAPTSDSDEPISLRGSNRAAVIGRHCLPAGVSCRLMSLI